MQAAIKMISKRSMKPPIRKTSHCRAITCLSRTLMLSNNSWTITMMLMRSTPRLPRVKTMERWSRIQMASYFPRVPKRSKQQWFIRIARRRRERSRTTLMLAAVHSNVWLESLPVPQWSRKLKPAISWSTTCNDRHQAGICLSKTRKLP